MPWLADTDVDAAHGLARSLVEAWSEAELRGRALHALAALVPADVLTWDRVELATGVVRHAWAGADKLWSVSRWGVVGRCALARVPRSHREA